MYLFHKHNSEINSTPDYFLIKQDFVGESKQQIYVP